MDHSKKLTVSELINQQFFYSGLDSWEHCLDRAWFAQWTQTIDYCFNSRGFRDQEWPKDLQSALWCVGDSFTLGLGSAWDHTWPRALSRLSGQRTVNISMDGASNEWIARNVCDVYDVAQPANTVIMWSYLHRRESKNTDLSDAQRRQHYVKSTVVDDYNNFLQCRKSVQAHCVGTNLIEFIIPNFGENFQDHNWQQIRDASWPLHMPQNSREFQLLNPSIVLEMRDLHGIDTDLLALHCTALDGVIRVTALDRARDGHHFDCVTADWVAQQALAQLV